MKTVKLLVALILAVGLMSLCGCSLSVANTEEMLTPPELSGDMKPIASALNASVKGSYTLKYPSSGDRRSAVVLEDIDGDNGFEAFALYSISNGETTAMHINIIRETDGKWTSVGDQEIIAGGVERIDFCDLDGDGVKEILVGWEIYGSSEKQLGVYSVSKDTITQRMLQKYTSFLFGDLDGDDEEELFLHYISAADSINKASVYSLTTGAVTETASCLLDSTVKTADEPVLSTLSSGQTAVYIDEIKGAGAITEVLYFKMGSLVNPLLDSTTGENLRTIRANTLKATDINQDGIIEIPVNEPILPSDTENNSEAGYYTKWCSFNGESLSGKLTTLMNVNEGYYITIPERWLGAVTVARDIEKRSLAFFSYDTEQGAIGDLLIYVRTVPVKEWDGGDYDSLGYTEILRNEDTVFLCTVDSADEKLRVSLQEMRQMLVLIQ